MKAEPIFPVPLRVIALVTCITLLSGCAIAPVPSAVDPVDVAAANDLGKARSLHFSDEERVGHYLDAAALTAPRLGSGKEASPAREIYNSAAGELTVFLRSEENGKLWNKPLTITGEKVTYHLRLQPAGPGVWSPDYFTSFEEANAMKAKLIKRKYENVEQGVGGELVGVRKTSPPEKFAAPKGIPAVVTATLDFKGNDASLALRRPTKGTTATIEGKTRPLAADYSAAISYYRPPNNLLLVGLMGGFRGENHAHRHGLFFLQPYDPDRIPIVFVHGLFSTPFTWVETINGLQADPEVRKHYQFWVFSYNTGNPILYSALQLREALAQVDQVYPNHKPYVVVGHSMGGMLTHAQVTTVTKEMWERDKKIGATAKEVFASNPPNSVIVRMATFRANPRIKRVVFICAPHRGSNLATSGFGRFGISLIKLPFKLAKTMTESLTSTQMAQITGSAKRMPTSVNGLKPSNPSFPIINSAPITVPYHCIIGDRGKGDSPNSSDGVVAYWSSHLDGAKSEKIVPGPHGSTGIPETITELDRILEVNLASSN